MASVEKLFDEKGRRRGDKVRWRTTTGEARATTFLRARGQTEADAKRWAVKVEADKHNGSALDPRAGKDTVESWAATWLASRDVREGSQTRAEDALILLRSMLGDRPLASIRQLDMEAWMKARRDQVKASTVIADWRWVRALFSAAVANRLRADNPCDGIKPEPAVKRQRVMPEPEQVLTIVNRLPASWAFLPLLGARTGMRPAELLGLCNEQVDWLRQSLLIDRQMLRGRVILQTKTASSHRLLPLDDETVQLLAGHLAAHPLGSPFPVVDGKGRPAGEGHLIFHRPFGGPISHRSVDDTWARQASRAGFPGLRVHDMRHFFASHGLRHGGDGALVLVSQLLGHSKPSITADIYAHELADRDERARSLVSAVWASTPAEEEEVGT